MILPETPLTVTVQRAEELRELVSRLKVQFLGQTLGMITASLGVAAFPEHGDDWEELIRTADTALYRAKKEGRNRVVVAPVLESAAPAKQAVGELEEGTEAAKAGQPAG